METVATLSKKEVEKTVATLTTIEKVAVLTVYNKGKYRFPETGLMGLGAAVEQQLPKPRSWSDRYGLVMAEKVNSAFDSLRRKGIAETNSAGTGFGSFTMSGHLTDSGKQIADFLAKIARKNADAKVREMRQQPLGMFI